MGILVENKYTRDEVWAKAMYAYMLFKQPHLIVCEIFLCICPFFVIAFLGVAHVTTWTTIGLIVLWIVMMAIQFNSSVRRRLQQDLEMNSGKPLEVTVQVTQEDIKFTYSSVDKGTLAYAEIKKVVRTKDYIYLLTKKNTVESIRRDSFTVGNELTLMNLFREKGLRVK